MSTDETPGPDQPDDGRVTEHWTYAGKRASGDDYPHLFLDAAGKERYFSGKVMAHPGIGARYAVSVLHRPDDDRVSAYIEAARYVGMTDDADAVARWRFENMAAEAERQKVLAEKRIHRDNGHIGDLTLTDLRDLLRRQPSMIRRGTIAAVTEWLLR